MKIKSSRLLALSLFSLQCLFHSAQVFNRVYEKPDAYDRTSRDIAKTVNGEYIIVGHTNKADATDSDLYVMLTDANGNMVWDTAYGGSKPEYAYYMAETADGLNYIVVGYSRSRPGGGGDLDMYVLKINNKGRFVQEAWIDFDNKNDEARQIVRTPSNEFLIIGSAGMPGSATSTQKSDLALVRINENLAVQKKEVLLPGSDHEYGICMLKVSDGYLLGGQTRSNGAANGDAWVIKLDNSYNQVWNKTYGVGLDDEVVSIATHNDGFAMLAMRDSLPGMTVDGNINVRLVKIDISNGNAVGQQYSYGDADKDTPKVIESVNGGGYLVGAISRSWGWMSPQIWLIRTNNDGDAWNGNGWWRSYGAVEDHDHVHQIHKSPGDNGFLIVGHWRKAGVMRIVFMKTDEFAQVGIEEASFAANGLALYPNPATEGRFNLKFSEEGTYRVTVNNLMGQQIYVSQEKMSAGAVKEIVLENAGTGMYLFTVQSEKGRSTAKVIVQ